MIGGERTSRCRLESQEVQDLRTPETFYAHVDTTVHELNHRLLVFVDEYRRVRRDRRGPLQVLDVGCGPYAVLSRALDPADAYVGCDIAPLAADVEVGEFHLVDASRDPLADKVGASRFDVVFCGEVIEHVFSPDAVLENLKTVMRDDGVLILSTPNLAYWVNRLLLLIGVSPLFVENSSRMKLGRRWRALGQGNLTEGHIRLFTYGAVKDLLASQQLTLRRVVASPVWALPIDRLIARLAPSFAPDVTYVATK
jgi:2-polyprenyl-3-methyl-5-hydroxy-6-metoxy-1,4-benzoquinol methylase